ncbi:MAG: hypothetical protein Q7T15_09350 [Microcella sp.]|uniref:hypothetical protein n=1 Tax=Microcella sp. TaxID=1913979 RepID=UPI00271E3003|nr:hypothetical protein [Microcella sp.]MDO8338443.1 hypothetical protein [Microcella sp.]
MHAIVSGEFHVHGSRDLDAETDALMDALLDLEAASAGVISDVDVTAILASATVTVTITVNADSLDAAEQIGMRIINQAIASSGGQTTKPTANSGDGAGYEAHRRASELMPV